MRKFLSLLVNVFMAVSANAQFHATPNGVVTDNGNPAYIVETNKSAATAFNDVKAGIVKKYGTQSITNTENGTSVTFRTHTPAAFKLKGDMVITVYAGVVMDLTIVCTDGKIEILPPIINEDIPVGLHGSYPKVAKGNMDFWYLYKNNGKPYNKKAITRFDEWLNNYMTDFIKCVR